MQYSSLPVLDQQCVLTPFLWHDVDKCCFISKIYLILIISPTVKLVYLYRFSKIPDQSSIFHISVF